MKRALMALLKRHPQDEVSLSEEDGNRYLHFGSVWIQGAMRMKDPFHLELDYTRQLFAGLLFNQQPKNFLLLGLGAASATKFAWKQFPKARVTTIDRNPAVIPCARQYFSLPPESTRHRTVVDDGAAWVAAHPASSDYLIVDVYDAAAKGPVLSSPEFYADCRNAMMSDRVSVMAVNLFGKHASSKINIDNIWRAFEGRVLLLPATERGNLIAFALTGPDIEVAWSELRARAVALRAATGLEFSQWVSALRETSKSRAGPTSHLTI